MGILDAPPTQQFQTVTKRVTMAIGSKGESSGSNVPGAALTTANPLDVNCRTIVKIPVTTTRWRLRIRNYSPLNENAGAGAITFTGAWTGTPDLTDAGLTSTNDTGPNAVASRWKGGMTATPSQALSSQALPLDASSDYFSPWVTDPALQFQTRTSHAVSYGFTSNGSSVTTFFDALATSFEGTSASNSSVCGSATVPSQTPWTRTWLDVRLEYEFSTVAGNAGVLSVVVLGDSGTNGNGDVAAQKLGAASFFHESWPGQAAQANGFVVTNMGIGTSSAFNFTAGTGWKWDRVDLATTVPDLAIISHGSNDIYFGRTSAQIMADVQTIAQKFRAMGVKYVGTGTVVPRNFGAFPAPANANLVRGVYNNALRDHSGGFDFVCDFDNAIRDASAKDTPDPNYYTAGPHPNRAGYGIMASRVNFSRSF